MTLLVERLLRVAGPVRMNNGSFSDIAHEAAATISRLTADNEALRADVRRLAEEHARIIEINKQHCKSVNSYITSSARLEDRAMAATARADALAQEVERLKAALAEAGESLDWAARRMKGNCSGSDVNAVMLAAGRTADARAALGDRP